MYDEEMRAAARAAMAAGGSLNAINAYPRLIDEAEAAVVAVHPSRLVHRVQAVGCVAVLSYWTHWPCLFPQHGPGRKHRPNALSVARREAVAKLDEFIGPKS